MTAPINPGTPDAPDPKAPIEKKTAVGTTLTLLASVVLATLNAVQADSSLLGGLPSGVQFVIIAVLPTLIQFLGQYATGWTPRNDLAARRAARERGLLITKIAA